MQLLLLVTKRERVMSNQELHWSLWPLTLLETNLASLIAEIRRALKDDARGLDARATSARS